MELPAGVVWHRSWLGPEAQVQMLADLRPVVAAAPLIQPITPWGRPMSVRMTAAGRLGWVVAQGRYGYAPRHPGTGAPWPPIPASVLAVWHAVAGWPDDPDCCLVNWYGADARMGMHRDADEGRFDAPVVSISLGDPARFRLGGLERRDPARNLILASGDVLVLGGPSRLAYHGITRVWFGQNTLIPGGGRLNLTLRVVA